MGNPEKFWNKIAKKYSASPIKNMEAYEQTMDRTRAYLSANDKVLEVGCGTGSTALLLAREVAHITATDISANMLSIGEDKARTQKIENVTFTQVPLPGTPLEEDAFNAVMAFSFLHLVEDLPAVLRSLHDSLKPGGVLISKTVCLGEQTRLWAVPIAVMRLFGFAPYVNCLTFSTLENALSDAGFEIVETALYPAPTARFVVAKKM